MDLASRLLLFVEVVELGSFVKVSEHRNIDRSVVSKQISKLEEELQVRLLNRTTRSLSLTSAGQEMVKQGRALRELLSDTKRVSQNFHSSPRGVLRITSTTFLGRYYVHSALVDFQKRYPEIEVELRLEDRLVDIVGEGYDIGFRIGIPQDSSLISRKIARNRLLIVAAPSLLEMHGHPSGVKDLEKMPAVVYSAAGYLADKIKYFEDGKENLIHLNPVHRVNEDDLILNAVIEGIGIAAVPAYMIGEEILAGALVPLMNELKLEQLGAFYAVYPHRDAPIKTRLFIDALRENIGYEKPIWERGIPNLT